MAQRFVESVNIDSKLIRRVDSKELQERLSHTSISLRESVIKDSLSNTGWEVPISRYNVKNANGRVYPKALWEKVLKEQRHIWEGAPMLADHPSEDSDGSPQNICGVWIGARLGEDGFVWGTVVPSGRLGEDLEDHLSKGLRAGTSSSGFGDLLEDGQTVDPKSFLIERLSDWVLTPSQGTYFSYESSTRETKNASDRSLEESVFEIEVSASGARRAFDFLKDRSYPFEATSSSSYEFEDYDEYRDAYDELEGMGIEIFSELIELNESGLQRGKPANKQKNVVRENNTMSKLTKLEEKKFRKDMEIFLEDASKIEDPQEQLQEYEEILSYLNEGAVPDLREQITSKIAEKRAEIKTMISESRLMKEELGVSGVADLKKKLTVIAEDTDLLKEESKDWKAVAQSLQKKLDETRREMKARPTVAYVNHLKSKINKFHASERTMTETLSKKEASLKSSQKKTEALVRDLEKKFGGSSSAVRAQRDLIERMTLEINNLKKEAVQLQGARVQAEKDLVDYKKAVLEAEKPKLQASPVDSIKKYMDFRETDEIESYWTDLYLRHGNEIKRYENRIRSAKTVREAMAIYMKVLPLMEETVSIDSIRIPESTAFSQKERARMLEDVGAQIEGTSFLDRKPSSWV